jgi:hypothetical protein
MRRSSCCDSGAAPGGLTLRFLVDDPGHRGGEVGGEASCAPDETPDETHQQTQHCGSGVGPGLPLQMHAFGPEILRDHPPPTLFNRSGGQAVLGGG